MHGADRLIVQGVLECRYFEQRAAGWLIFIFCRINFQPCAWVQTQSGQVAGKPAVSRLYFRYYFPMGYFLMRLPSLNAAGARQRRGEKPTSSAVSPIAPKRCAAKAIWTNYPKMQRTTFALKASMLLKIFKEKVWCRTCPQRRSGQMKKKQDRRLPTASQNRNCRPVGNVRNFWTPRGAPGSMWGSVGEVFGKFWTLLGRL